MLGDRLLNTIAGVFPVTYVWNGMAYAMVSPAGIELMKHRLEANAFAPALKALGTGALAGLRPVSYLPEEGVFTDDLAPIEAMTHDLLEHRGDRGRKTMD